MTAKPASPRGRVGLRRRRCLVARDSHAGSVEQAQPVLAEPKSHGRPGWRAAMRLGADPTTSLTVIALAQKAMGRGAEAQRNYWRAEEMWSKRAPRDPVAEAIRARAAALIGADG